LLNSKPAKNLKPLLVIDKSIDYPFDKDRLELFKVLFTELTNGEYELLHDKNVTNESYKNFAFFESYFSNYIEGTLFSIDEAKKIIEDRTSISAASKNSHDILGTYLLASNREAMKQVPQSPEELIEMLKRRHAILLSARTNTTPGQFKEKNNQAGNTYFVEYSLVIGTLIKGFELYNNLEGSFRKAAFMMFMISEIHPFWDGNGRIARIMMNAEFTKNHESKIIIPTVFREDYLLSLKKLSSSKDPKPYIAMLEKAHKFSEGIHSDNFDEMKKYMVFIKILVQLYINK